MDKQKMDGNIKTNVSNFRTHCGYERVGERLHITVGTEHLNGGGILHGGLSATMLDHVSSHPVDLKENQIMSTVGLNVQYLNPAKLGDKLIASATLKKQGRSTAIIDAIIETENGTLIATSSAIYKVITLTK